jgi:hypothetical protein
VRRGINSAINDFVDHYAKPAANPDEGAPALDVSASLQVCPLNAGEGSPLDEPGPRFTAPTFDELAPNVLRLDFDGEQTTTSKAAPNPHALAADPVANEVSNSKRCPRGEGPAGPGVASYASEPLERTYTMIGPTRVTVPYEASREQELQLNARMYDVPPDGEPAMVDRGFRTLTQRSGVAVIDLMGNGWRFARGHRVRIELAQDDDPFLRASTVPSQMTLDGVTLRIPVREETDLAVPISGRGVPGGGGGGDPGGRDPDDSSPARAGELPFTGLELGPIVALGLMMMAAGLTLHTAVRRA